MSAEKRPGGLTAIAVINFVWGGFSLLGIFGLILFLNMESILDLPESEKQELIEARAEAFGQGDIEAFIYFAILTSLAVGALLIVSGIGYLQQKKFLGRALGNAYAAVSILTLFLGMAMIEGRAGEFDLSTMISLVYPLLTLFLLNVTFKEDFVR